MVLNKVMLAGNLTRDVELRHTAGDKAVANVGMAINNKYKAADGTVKEDVTFVDCEAWGKTAESMAQYLSKGRPVYVEGRLRLEQWDDKNGGGKRSKLKVVVDSWQFVGPRPDGEQREAAPAQAPAQRPQTKRDVVSGVVYTPIDDDSVPF